MSGDVGDVEHIRPVQHRQRGAVVHLVDNGQQVILRHPLQAVGAPEGGAQLQHLGPQHELAAVDGHVAELTQGVQVAARGGGALSGGRSDLGKGHFRPIRPEGADHR